MDVDKRKKEIIAIVEKMYNRNIENLYENLEYYIKLVIDKYIDSDTSLEDIEKEISEEINRKRVSKWSEENYRKYLTIMEVVDSIAQVPKNEIEKYILENINELSDMSMEELIKRTENEFSLYRITDFKYNAEIPNIIQGVLSSSQTRSLINSVLSNKETINKHAENAINGEYLGNNIVKTQQLIGFLMQYIIVYGSDYKIDEVISALNSMDLNDLEENELNQLFCKIIVRAISSKLSLNETASVETKKKIIEFISQNYIENGFCVQGTNGMYKESVVTNGLTCSFSRENEQELKVIDEIFQAHGLNKIFFSKIDEASFVPYYYLTDDMALAYHYSFHNPEWFAYFVATGNDMPDYKYDRTAYYLRNYDACKQNVEKLLANYHIIGEEKERIISFFENSWNQIAQNKSSNLITFVPRKLINRNMIEPLSEETIKVMSAEKIVEYYLKSRYQIDKQYIDIPKKFCTTINVPLLSDFYNEESFDKARTKFIKLKDGSKYYYDILIGAHEVDYDCITVVDKLQTPKREKRIAYPSKPIDIISVSKDIQPQDVLSNGKPSYQSIAMMIAVNGNPNSEKGKEVLDRCREYFPVSYMKDYYYHLCQLCCELSLCEDYQSDQRLAALYRMITDFYPKAEVMASTGNYPEFINAQKKTYSYLSYPQQQMLEKISEARKRNSVLDRELIEEVVNLFRSNLDGKIDKSFSPEFENQLEILGFSKHIKRRKSQELINSAIEATKEIAKTSTINQVGEYIELSQTTDKGKDNERKI
ncbi:MAG: hypothetical protein IJB90_01105 [Clostridia bacterium]|nr:hypothetical protein [Clostridia bacterium]